MKKTLYGLIGAAMLLVPVMTTAADDERSYTEGTVLDVSAVRTKPGMFDTYLKWLSTTYKPMMEEQKKAGIILNYAVYAGSPRTPSDPDLYLVTEYKNMAALDDLDAKIDPISRKYWATMAAADKAAADRESIRQILGDELLRELKLK
jgi:L-rhamnose mutarotase